MILNNENFSDLKAGDQIIVFSSSWGEKYYALGEVKRVTPTGRIVVDVAGSERTFYSNGSERANYSASLNHHYLRRVTDEILDEIKRKKYVQYCSRQIKFDDLSLDALRKIARIAQDEMNAAKTKRITKNKFKKREGELK